MKSLLSLVTLSLVLTVGASAQSGYTITDLGGNIGYAINNSGNVVGDNSIHAFLYNAGAVTDLGTLGGSWSHADGINDSAQITGWAYTQGDTSVHAFVYDAGTGRITDVGTLGGGFSGAGADNKLGQIVGSADLPGDYVEHTFLYSAGTGIVDLNSQIPSGSGWVLFTGSSINDSGQITGDAQTPNSGTGSHGFIYSSGSLTDLGTLGGQSSTAAQINSQGQVAGTSYTGVLDARYGYQYRAFLYSARVMTDLGTPTGLTSRGRSLNNSGEVTGSFMVTTQPSQAQPYQYHAFLYTAGTGMIDLNSLLPADSGWTLIDGLGINDAGQITGVGAIDGYQHGFILSPPLSQQLTNLVNALPTSLQTLLLPYIPNITTAISSLTTKKKTTYITQLQNFESTLPTSGLPSSQVTVLTNLANTLIAALSA